MAKGLEGVDASGVVGLAVENEDSLGVVVGAGAGVVVIEGVEGDGADTADGLETVWSAGDDRLAASGEFFKKEAADLAGPVGVEVGADGVDGVDEVGFDGVEVGLRAGETAGDTVEDVLRGDTVLVAAGEGLGTEPLLERVF